MKYVKMLGLAAVAAMALMAFAGAGTASAGGVLCSTTVSPCPSAQKLANGTVLDFSLVAKGSATLETTGGTTVDTCTAATVKGTLGENPSTKEGSVGEATGTNTEITWGAPETACTKPATTLKPGKLKINNITGTSNGTVVADDEITVTIPGLFSGENCIYGVTPGTTIGELKEGNPAIFTANAVATKIADATDKCTFGPADTKWTAEYQLTSPANTTVSVSSS